MPIFYALNYDIEDIAKPDGILQINLPLSHWITAICFGELLITGKFANNGKLICN